MEQIQNNQQSYWELFDLHDSNYLNCLTGNLMILVFLWFYKTKTESVRLIKILLYSFFYLLLISELISAPSTTILPVGTLVFQLSISLLILLFRKPLKEGLNLLSVPLNVLEN